MFDLRLPIGVFFLIIGALLAVYGAVKPFSPEGVSLNVDLDWGIVLAIFGALMAVFGWLAQRSGENTGGTAAAKAPDKRTGK